MALSDGRRRGYSPSYEVSDGDDDGTVEKMVDDVDVQEQNQETDFGIVCIFCDDFDWCVLFLFLNFA